MTPCFNKRELIVAMLSVTYVNSDHRQGKKVFMTGFPNTKINDIGSDRTDNSKGEDEEKFFVEKVIKMHVNKQGKEEFLVKWVGYPLSQATWEPFENLSGEEACEYLVIFYLYNQTTCTPKNLANFFFKDEEAMAMKEGKSNTTTSHVNL